MLPARVQNSGARDHHDATRFHREGGSDVAGAIEHGDFGERGARALRMKHLLAAADRCPNEPDTSGEDDEQPRRRLAFLEDHAAFWDRAQPAVARQG